MVLAGRGMRDFFPRESPRPSSSKPAPTLYGCYASGMAASTFIERCTSLDQPGWLEMRQQLWSDADADDHRGYMAISLAQPERYVQFVVYDHTRQPLGFIEGSIRSDYVNGTATSPVGFVEGVFVKPEWRCRGIARQLFTAVADWARAHGCRELASDALIDNEISQRAHLSLGFRETERVVYFTRPL
jgi:aminoglycoside 6'-N-acetyltransferase I